LAQAAINESRLESLFASFRVSLNKAFEVLNDSVRHTPFALDAATQQALTDLGTHQEKLKDSLKQLVLKPKTAESIHVCLDQLDQDAKRLTSEFKRIGA
jgi:hypothetical protein